MPTIRGEGGPDLEDRAPRNDLSEEYHVADGEILNPMPPDPIIAEDFQRGIFEQLMVGNRPRGLTAKTLRQCHAVDSTPFEGCALRMSELATIVAVAFFNHSKPEYNQQNCFGVTVLSFWNHEVRIVQGLVNLRTCEIDIRISPVQNFAGSCMRSEHGDFDPLFLKLLAYSCGEVLPCDSRGP